MTVVKNAHTAKVGSVSLGAISGEVSLDASRVRHVEASVTIAKPSAAVLAMLDPRTSPAPRVKVTCTPEGGKPRLFDLTVRTRPIDHKARSVALTLASDEALLEDYAPLENIDLYDLAGDLKALVSTVLTQALGATPTITGPTADRTPYWDATNYVQNSSFQTNTDRWQAVGAGGARDTAWNSVGGSSLRLDATSADSYARTPDAEFGVLRPGRVYTASGDYRIAAKLPGGTSPRTRRIVAFVKAPSLGSSYVEYASDALPNVANASGRVAVTFRVPEDATDAFVRFYNGHTSGSIWIDAVSLTADSRHTPYFDSTWPPSPGYVYFRNADGTHQRHAVLDGPSPDAFLWRAGQSAMDFLHPLVQSVGLRLVCDELRRWSLRPETYTAPGALTLRHGVNLIDEQESISRDAGYWFDAAVRRYTWKDPVTGVEMERVDAFAATTPHTRLSLIELSTPYPGPGRAEYAVRRAKGVGREVTVTALADWAAVAEMPLTLSVADAGPLFGVSVSVAFNLGEDSMTVTTRSRDVPTHAWILQSAGRWKNGPAGQSWKGAS